MGESGRSIFRRPRRNHVAEGLPPDLGGGGRHFGSTGREMGSGNIESGRMGLRSDELVSDNSTLLSLQPWVFQKGFFQADVNQRMMRLGDEHGYIVDVDDSEPPSSPRSYSFAYGSGRSHGSSIKSSSLRTGARRCSVKAINSVENSLIPQFYGDGFETKEFIFSPPSSPSIPSTRPFCVTDGNQIISKSGNDPLDANPPKFFNMDVNRAQSRETGDWNGSPHETKKLRRKSEEMQLGGLSASDSTSSCNHLTILETRDRLLLFCVGIGIGLISSLLASRKEVEQLNDLLKHKENLVQDLQEELDMKDSFTVDELANDVHEKQQFEYISDMQEQADSIHKEAPEFQPAKHDITILHQSNSRKEAGNSEDLSQIEAELEAELQRLELNLCSSSFEGITSPLDELDPDLTANVVRGELRADKLKKSNDVTCDFHEDSGRTLTPQNHPVDYSVSPRELSLRLHELNQSILEQRILELEAKLCHSQKQLQHMELEKMDSLNSGSEIGSSSNHTSPIIMEKGEDMSKPLRLDLSGDALDSYKEAYEEFARVTGMENPPSLKMNSFEPVNSGDSFFSDGTSLWDMQDETYQHFSYCEDKKSFWNDVLNQGSNTSTLIDYLQTNEKSDDDDDEGRMLIQKLVHKVRQDSSIVLNAQEMLFSMDK